MTRPAAPTVGGEPVSRDTPARRAPPATGRAPCGPRQGPGSANRPCKCRSGNVLHVKPNLTIFNRLGHLDHRAPVRVVDPRSYPGPLARDRQDRKSTRLNSSHTVISYAVFCLKKKKKHTTRKMIQTKSTK